MVAQIYHHTQACRVTVVANIERFVVVITSLCFFPLDNKYTR